ncbi:Uncharacterized membrane protein YiaA [Oceanobacillus limi]|uniref:Uncharacterized membrane protein YiaA n=2 Tax=Oceanobacillus limi TaxID=930131 RepID=A0A1H9Y131_9BACI|nr:inner membrane protein YiaA [Oceanobacillus limi]SES61939.1 Uncharacterized membrane protein YiaA [Oceanobacillus limi]
MSEPKEVIFEKDEHENPKPEMKRVEGKPTSAFKGASWSALLIGVVAYLIGLYNATMELNEKGYYFALLVFGLYAAISLQKTVRDKEEGIPVTNIYYGVSWVAIIIVLILMAVGLYNAGSITLSEKGFYAMAYVLSIFAAITVQKNIRDSHRAREKE